MIALPLAIALHLLAFYALQKYWRMPLHLSIAPQALSVRLLTVLPSVSAPLEFVPKKMRAAEPRQSKRAEAIEVDTLPETQAHEQKPSVASDRHLQLEQGRTNRPGAISLTQSAIVGALQIDRVDQKGERNLMKLAPKTVQTQLAANIEKAGKPRLGSIEEVVLPSGGRETKANWGPLSYCVSYDSPSNNTDGKDMIQNGMQMETHICGHHFDH